jgi:polyisoprenoid-binding protein YceI
MRRLVCAAAAAAFTFWAAPDVARAQDARRPIDAAKSKARFSIRHVFVEKVEGVIPIVGGTVTLAPDAVIPSAVTAVLDPARTDSGDKDRDAALESPDYFDIRAFPQWTFASTAVKATGPSAFAMDGTLTIHGVSRPEHLDVTVSGPRDRPAYHATGRIDRHAFGMKGARLDPVIGDTADVTLDIVLAP